MKNYKSRLVGVAIVVLAIGGCGGGSKDPSSSGGLSTGIYRALTSSGFLKDTRIREKAPSQTQGTFATIKIGEDNGGSMDGLFIDSSVVFLDSIPAGADIVACTLFIKVAQLPSNDNDSVVLDLWSLPEAWNEDDASWDSRTGAANWAVAGGGGSLVEAGAVTVTRLSVTAFRWSIDDVEYGTFAVADTATLPIPIDTSLARMNYEGTSFGFALRNNALTATDALVTFYTSENGASVNRPYILWVFEE